MRNDEVWYLGLSDEWEIDYLKDIDFAFSAEDPDKDGYNNKSEEGFGTDPTDPKSQLDFTIVRPDLKSLVLR